MSVEQNRDVQIGLDRGRSIGIYISWIGTRPDRPSHPGPALQKTKETQKETQKETLNKA